MKHVFFSHDERSLRGYLIEDIEKKKLKAEEFLKTCREIINPR